ncbi:MAG: hypothetical protein ACO1SV_21500 [Fimbriimonas sp.]
MIQVARWARVAPWELARQPLYWLDRIETVMIATFQGERDWERANRPKDRKGR